MRDSQPDILSNLYCRYKYSKDDEEIYKEFMEINNELIPHILKTEGELAKGLVRLYLE